MAFIEIENFKYGIDARRSELTSVPGTMLTLNNCHINQGGEIEKRKAFVRFSPFNSFSETNWFGLESTDAGLTVFGSYYVYGTSGKSGRTLSAAIVTPQQGMVIVYQQLLHPAEAFSNANASIGWTYDSTKHKMTAVKWSCCYLGSALVAATFADGNTFLYYNGVCVPASYSGLMLAGFTTAADGEKFMLASFNSNLPSAYTYNFSPTWASGLYGFNSYTALLNLGTGSSGVTWTASEKSVSGQMGVTKIPSIASIQGTAGYVLVPLSGGAAILYGTTLFTYTFAVPLSQTLLTPYNILNGSSSGTINLYDSNDTATRLAAKASASIPYTIAAGKPYAISLAFTVNSSANDYIQFACGNTSYVFWLHTSVTTFPTQAQISSAIIVSGFFLVVQIGANLAATLTNLVTAMTKYLGSMYTITSTGTSLVFTPLYGGSYQNNNAEWITNNSAFNLAVNNVFTSNGVTNTNTAYFSGGTDSDSFSAQPLVGTPGQGVIYYSSAPAVNDTITVAGVTFTYVTAPGSDITKIQQTSNLANSVTNAATVITNYFANSSTWSGFITATAYQSTPALTVQTANCTSLSENLTVTGSAMSVPSYYSSKLFGGYDTCLVFSNPLLTYSTPQYVSGSVPTYTWLSSTGSATNQLVVTSNDPVASNATGTPPAQTSKNYTLSASTYTMPASGTTVAIGMSGTWLAGETASATFTTGVSFTMGTSRLNGCIYNNGYTFNNRLYIGNGNQFNYSTPGDPTQWDVQGGNNGYIPYTSYFGAQDAVQSFASYQGRLAVFGRRSIQIWVTNADSTQFALQQTLANIGTVAPFSVQPMGELDVFFLADTGVRSLRVRDSSLNAYANDLGSAIDSLVLDQKYGNSNYSKAHSVIDSESQRYWLYIPDSSGTTGVMYVLSYFPTNKIVAWSIYYTTYQNGSNQVNFNPTLMKAHQGQVFLRDASALYAYGGNGSNVYDNALAEAQTTYFAGSGKREASASWKKAKGVNIVCNGTWTIKASMDWLTGTLTTADTQSALATYDQGQVPLSMDGTHFSLYASTTDVYTNNNPPSLSSIMFMYEPAQET